MYAPFWLMVLLFPLSQADTPFIQNSRHPEEADGLLCDHRPGVGNLHGVLLCTLNADGFAEVRTADEVPVGPSIC